MSANNCKIYLVVISAEQSGQRLDKFLASLDFISSRTRAAELIEQGLVRLKGNPLKASHKVRSADQLEITLPPPAPSTLQPLNAPLDLLFEDEDLLVLNKPAGLVVHPSAGHAQDTLVNILLYHVRHLSMGFAENRPGIVHRLDRDTSGILVVAKNDFAHHHLAQQFRLKTAHRIYWALVHGLSPVNERTLRSYLARHPQDRKRFASNPEAQGKLAITHYKVLAALPNHFSWIQCQLETGRTHQIRVHLSEAGLPIVGDVLYGGRNRLKDVAKKYLPAIESFKRVALHACELGFEHPRTHERMNFRVTWPSELCDLYNRLGFNDV